MSNAVKGIVCIVVLLLALSAVVGLGAWLAGRHYQPTIDNLNDKLSKCGSLKDQANATIHSQNAAITALQQAAAIREKAAKDAVAAPANLPRMITAKPVMFWLSALMDLMFALLHLQRSTLSWRGSVRNEMADDNAGRRTDRLLWARRCP